MKFFKFDILNLVIVLFLVPTLLPAFHHTSLSLNPKGRTVFDSYASPQVQLRAASGRTIHFKTQNGQDIRGSISQEKIIPHLVLRRNGQLTGYDERTLIVAVEDILLPPGGLTLRLKIETQSPDPDQRDLRADRIGVVSSYQTLENPSSFFLPGRRAVFIIKFGQNIIRDSLAYPTPTDYFHYELSISRPEQPNSEPLYKFSEDYAFLMENQVVVPLTGLNEESEGAAPDELVVFYCDMFPIQRGKHALNTRIKRLNVESYVQGKLVPAFLAAIYQQSNQWDFPWSESWTSERPGEDSRKLSVALTSSGTWYHGRAPTSAHSGITLVTNHQGLAAYKTLTSGLVSYFHHELFHNLQRNLNLEQGGEGWLAGKDNSWSYFSEGTAVLAASIAQPASQLDRSILDQDYLSHANIFLAGDRFFADDLNTSFHDLENYRAAIYWRFLYEQCGGLDHYTEDPASGWRVIRNVLSTLYGSQLVDVRVSDDIVNYFPSILNTALVSSGCPFDTYRESLAAFARSIYALRLEGGRCLGQATPPGCGLYDPQGSYAQPPVEKIFFTGDNLLYGPFGIKNSYGIDFVEIVLDSETDGKSLSLTISGEPGSRAVFDVQIWRIKERGQSRPKAVPSLAIQPVRLPGSKPGEFLRYSIPQVDLRTFDGLALILTRTDPYEAEDPVGSYSILIRSAEVNQSGPK